MMEKLCKNCKWCKQTYNTPTMDGKTPIYISCCFLKDGIKVRGIRAEDCACSDWEDLEDEMLSVWKDKDGVSYTIIDTHSYGEISLEKDNEKCDYSPG